MRFLSNESADQESDRDLFALCQVGSSRGGLHFYSGGTILYLAFLRTCSHIEYLIDHQSVLVVTAVYFQELDRNFSSVDQNVPHGHHTVSFLRLASRFGDPRP